MQNLRLCIELANEDPSHLERGMPDSAQVPVDALVRDRPRTAHSTAHSPSGVCG
jgi:hypothetical protein